MTRPSRDPSADAPSAAPHPHLHEAMRRVLEPAVTAGEIPGAVAIAGTADAACAPLALGVRRLQGHATTPDTRYDLASLTKVAATLPALLRLASDGALSLDDRVGAFFANAGWFQQPSLADATLRQLLAHASGLPAWRPLYALVSERRTAIANVLQSTVEHPIGEVCYSDLGFILLGAVVERASGRRLDQFVRERVHGPLGLPTLHFGPLRGVPIAATENCGWRGRLLEGEAHDENAWMMDGVAGHAGLFGTAADVAAYAQAWLRRDPRLADPELLTEAQRPQAGGPLRPRGLGWALAADGAAPAPDPTPAPTPDPTPDDWRGARGYGHTGFTGTSLWIDPGPEGAEGAEGGEGGGGWFAVLLTNRVHPDRTHGRAMNRIRGELHRAVARAHAEAQA